MSLFTKIFLIIIAVGVIGGGLIGGIFFMKRGSPDEQSATNSSTITNTVADTQKNLNTNSPTSLANTNNTNTTGVSSNTNTVVTTNKNTNTPNTNVSEDCKSIDVAGVWSLTTDVEGANFTPPYAKDAHNFDFKSDGTVNFTENYNSDETTATAQHTGNWQLDGCNFTYKGIAKGNGLDEDVGAFTFTFDVTATGEVSSSDTAMKGFWNSVETYVSEEATTKQTVTGEWVAKKL